MYQIKCNGYTRISKQKARKMYDAGETVYLLPWRLVPGTCWGLMYDANYYNWNKCEPFDTVVAAFEMYNCGSQYGKYTAFYKKDTIST